MQKISEDSKNSHLKFSNSLKSNVKNSIQKISSSHLNFVPRPRPRAPRLQLVGRPPVVEVEAPQVKSWAKRSRQRCASNFKQNNFIFWINHIITLILKKKKLNMISTINTYWTIPVDLHRGRSAPHPWPPCAGRRTGAWPQPGAQHTDVADGAQVGKKSWKIWMDTMKTWEKWTFSSKGWKRQSCQKSYKRVKECWGAWF